jgi:hypothetical protein
VQLIASGLDVGFINNLSASFWKAPVFGILLSRHLLSDGYTSGYASDFGRTRHIQEPHEFGYFWRDLLGYEELKEPMDVSMHEVDWHRVRQVLNNLCHATRKPMVFKSFLVSWQLQQMSAALPGTCMVRVTRDPVETALSLLNMREKMFGSKEAWASIKPKEYDVLREEPYWVQVAGQVYYLDRLLDEQFGKIDPARKVVCSLAQLRRAPNDVLQEIRDKIAGAGGTIEFRQQIECTFPAREVSATVSDRQRVERAIAQFYGEA